MFCPEKSRGRKWGDLPKWSLTRKRPLKRWWWVWCWTSCQCQCHHFFWASWVFSFLFHYSFCFMVQCGRFSRLPVSFLAYRFSLYLSRKTELNCTISGSRSQLVRQIQTSWVKAISLSPSIIRDRSESQWTSHYGAYLWPPYVIGQGQAIIFSSCGFFFLSIFLSIFYLFFCRLISAVGDWMSTILPYMLWS